MIPCAYVVHRIRGRMRLRVREKRNDCEFFDEVVRQLNTLPGVDEVRANSITGTVLLLHSGQSYDQIINDLRQLGLLEVVDGPEPSVSALASLSSGLSQIDQALLTSSEGRVDLRVLAYIGLMVITVSQIMRGQVLGPALPVIWQAFSLLDKVNGWRDGAVEEITGQTDTSSMDDV